MAHILALDQGTTSSRAIVFDDAGRPLAAAQREFEQFFPRPGLVEHDPEEIARTQIEVARRAIEEAGVDASDLAGVGIANQRETTVLWDRRTGEPLGRAIVWQDRRTASICERMKREGLEPMFRERTGLLLDPYFSGTKLRWMLDAVEGADARAGRGELAFGTIDSWLIHRLTGGRVHATDVTNASRTLMFNIHTGEWDPALLDALGIPPAVLPEVVASSGIVAETDAEVLGASLPIAGIAGDQQAALFGQMCLEPGMLKTTYGTGCFLLATTGPTPRASHHKLLTTPAWRIGEATTYALEGSVFTGGAVVQWLRDQLGLIASSGEVESLASSVDDNGGVYLVPAFAGLGAPHWDASARGAVVGLTRGSNRGHLARAALESIAFQIADVVDAVRDDAADPPSEVRVDGGAAANDLLMQFQADLLGIPLARPAVTETTAFGAACLAGLAVGARGGARELAESWSADRVFEPAMSEDRRRTMRRQWARAVDRAKAWREERDEPRDGDEA